MGGEDGREGGRPEIFPYLSQSTVIAIVRPFGRSFSQLPLVFIADRLRRRSTAATTVTGIPLAPGNERPRPSVHQTESGKFRGLLSSRGFEKMPQVRCGEVEFHRRDEISSVIFIQPSGHLRETDPSSMRRLVHRPMKRGNGSGRVRTRTDEHILGATSFIYFCWR